VQRIENSVKPTIAGLGVGVRNGDYSACWSSFAQELVNTLAFFRLMQTDLETRFGLFATAGNQL
jgi:hypothetical protein